MKLAEALSEYKRQSSGQYKGMCPFRENHSARAMGAKSFYMTPELNAYHCFSCHAKGRLTTLLTTKFGVSLWDALDFVTLDLLGEKPEKIKTPETLTVEWSVQPRMFLDRGFGKRLLKSFRVGCYTDEKGREVATIPMYKGKNLVGVVYRIDKPHRQIWSSDDFDKDHFLYNQGDYPEAILVEGLTDLWRVFQHGYENVVCLQGTHCSPYALEWLQTRKIVYLALDLDLAGIRATETIYHKISRHTEVLFVPYPATDPEKTTQEQWIRAMRGATSYGEYAMAMYEIFGDEYIVLKEQVKKALRV
jgi:DNA primase